MPDVAFVSGGVPPAVSETPAWILRGQCRG
jgi:hypothetical protein